MLLGHEKYSPWGWFCRRRGQGGRAVMAGNSRLHYGEISWKGMEGGIWWSSLNYFNCAICIFASLPRDSHLFIASQDSRAEDVGDKTLEDKTPEGLSNWIQKIWGGDGGQQKLLGQTALSHGNPQLTKWPPNFQPFFMSGSNVRGNFAILPRE